MVTFKKSFMKKIYFCLVVLLTAGNLVSAGSLGTSGAAFLKILPGTRAQAMGGAYTALASGINGTCWNPAGIAFSGDKEFSAMYMEWISGIRYSFLGYAHPVGDDMAFGISGIYLSTKVDGRDEIGQRTGDIDFGSFAGTVNCSYLFSEWSSWGVNIKYIKEDIGSDNVKASAYDIGNLYRFLDGKLRFGLSAQNLGSKIGKDNLPLNFKVGIAVLPWKDKFTFAFDANFPNDNKEHFNAGMEYRPIELIALRCGYPSSFGVGIIHGSEYTTGSIDLACLPYGDLGNVYNVSYTIRF